MVNNVIRSTGENIIAGVLLIALLVGGIVLLTRHSGEESSPIYLNRRVSNKVKHFSIVEDAPIESKPAKRYDNTEVREIEWSERGLPTKITIHRSAVQT